MNCPEKANVKFVADRTTTPEVLIYINDSLEIVASNDHFSQTICQITNEGKLRLFSLDKKHAAELGLEVSESITRLIEKDYLSSQGKSNCIALM